MAKLKAKTKAAAKKRFRITGSGKLVCQSAGAAHIRGKKTMRTLRFKMAKKTVNNAIIPMLQCLLPNGIKGRGIKDTKRSM